MDVKSRKYVLLFSRILSGVLFICGSLVIAYSFITLLTSAEVDHIHVYKSILAGLIVIALSIIVYHLKPLITTRASNDKTELLSVMKVLKKLILSIIALLMIIRLLDTLNNNKSVQVLINSIDILILIASGLYFGIYHLQSLTPIKIQGEFELKSDGTKYVLVGLFIFLFLIIMNRDTTSSLTFRTIKELLLKHNGFVEGIFLVIRIDLMMLCLFSILYLLVDKYSLKDKVINILMIIFILLSSLIILLFFLSVKSSLSISMILILGILSLILLLSTFLLYEFKVLLRNRLGDYI